MAAPSARTRTTAGSASLPDTVPLAGRDAGPRAAGRATTGSTRSSTTVTASRRAWTVRTCVCSPAAARTGPAGSRSWPGRSRSMGVAGTWLDGEVVVFDRHGISDFQALQGSLTESSPVLSYIVFDLLFEDGEDLRRLPLRERKARLLALLARAGAGDRRPCATATTSRAAAARCSPRPAGAAWRASSPNAPATATPAGGPPPGRRPSAAAVRSSWSAATRSRQVRAPDSARCSWASTTAVGFSMPDASARASTTRRSPGWRRVWHRWSAPTLPSRTRRAAPRPAGCTGSRRTSWPRSPSPDGRRTTGCGSRCSKACARTRPPTLWCGRSRPAGTEAQAARAPEPGRGHAGPPQPQPRTAKRRSAA